MFHCIYYICGLSAIYDTVFVSDLSLHTFISPAARQSTSHVSLSRTLATRTRILLQWLKTHVFAYNKKIIDNENDLVNER